MKYQKIIAVYIIVLFFSACGGSSDNSSSSRSEPSGNDSTSPSPQATSTVTPIMPATPTPEVDHTPIPGTTPTPTSTPTPAPNVTETPQNSRLTVLDCGEISGDIVNNELNAEAKEYILCKHNQTRSQSALGAFQGTAGLLPVATNMQRLQWDNKLEEVAQNYANQCIWGHNSSRTSQYNALSPTDALGQAIIGNESVGENLAFFASSNLTSATLQFAVNGYDAWEEEGEGYSFGALNVSDFCGVAACGHFTQIIWATTYKVGCAVNFCETGTVSRFPATYLVCNYASAGNFVSREPYNTASSSTDVCSNAISGQTVCQNGLTSFP